jgi:protein ImuB
MMARPVAIAPEPGGVQVIGDVSGPAEAFGVTAGMRLGEALGRCPQLALVPADPQRAEEAWGESLSVLEGIGAAVESRRPGEAFFGLDGLRALWGRPERALERARKLLGQSVRLGAGPTRLCALSAALRSRPRRPVSAAIVPERHARSFLSRLEVGVLRDRMGDEWTGVNLVDTLERLGVFTLGELADLPDDAVADRFGEPGLRALRMARGTEEPLRPRQPRAELREEIELHEAATAGHLDRALELLVDRLLANPLRRGRSFRRLRIEARLAGGGGWRIDAPTRQATANRERLMLLLRPKLGALPAPATRIALRALELGEAPPRQPTLQADEAEERRSRVAEAVRHARAAAGRGAVLKVLEVDPGADVPERWATLTPFPEDGSAGGRKPAGNSGHSPSPSVDSPPTFGVDPTLGARKAS